MQPVQLYQKYNQYLAQACSIYYVMRANLGKIWSACRQHEIKYTKWRM